MSKLNLLFIFTDEQRFDTLATYGNSHIQMPNLDRLAEESVVFDEAYVTQPVCTPSRASIMTGLYPHTHGCTENNARLPADVPCLPEMLASDGYVTAYYGKWHLGDEIFAQHGFQDWVSIDDGYAKYYSPGRDPEARSSYHHFLVDHGFRPANGRHFTRYEAAQMEEQFSKPAFVANEACRFIKENKDRPFILYVNFFEPHMPFFGPRNGQYDPADIPLPSNFNALPTEAQPLKTRLFQQGYYQVGNHGLPLRSEADWRRIIANYWGLCSLVDTHAGRILAMLDECELRDETVVVFTSDHGDMMGSHRLLAKCVMFQEAVRVPLIIRLPGQSAQRRVRGPFSQIDLVPTLLTLLDQPVPESLQGKSLTPVLEQPGDVTLHDDVFIEWNGPNNGFGDILGQVSIPDWMAKLAPAEEIEAATRDPVRTVVTADGWKLNYSPRGEHELYDLRIDPMETQNLAATPEMNDVMQNLVARLRRWQARTGDTYSV